MTPASKIVFSLAGLAGAAVLLSAALVFGALDRLALRSGEANVDFLLSQLRGSIEANVGLGLPLADIRLVQNLVEQAKASEDRVLAIEVFSPSGISLFNTDRGAIGEEIPPEWRAAIRRNLIDDRWRAEGLGTIVVGEAMYNDFGEPVGHLAVTMSGELRQEHAQGLLMSLASRVALVLPLVLAVVLVSASLLFARRTREVRNLAAALGGAATAAAALPAELAVRVRTTVDRAVSDYDRAATEILKMDEY